MTAAKELAEKKKTGRPTAFSDKVAADIIAACRSGFTMEKAAELVGLEPRTVANWVYKRPVFGEQIKKARKEHELSLLRSIEEAGAKSWQAKAWIAERVYQYAQPSSRLEVAGAVAHAHAASPALAQLLAGMNSNAVKSVDGIGNGPPQLLNHKSKTSELYSGSIGQKKARRVPRYSKRPTPPRPTGQPPAPSTTHNTPQKIATKNKKGSDASTTATNENPQESPQQAA